MKKLSYIFGIAGLLLIISNGYSFWKGVTATEKYVQPIQVNQPNTGVKQPKEGELIGTLTIPSLKLKVPIYHGTTENELKQGVGHYQKSGLPGENRHIVLTGHRDTVFRKLEHIQKEQYIWLEMKDGTYQYKINHIKIVNQYDRTILVEKPEETLTLITCYPFQYIGNAPERFIISAKLIEKHNGTNLSHH